MPRFHGVSITRPGAGRSRGGIIVGNKKVSSVFPQHPLPSTKFVDESTLVTDTGDKTATASPSTTTATAAAAAAAATTPRRATFLQNEDDEDDALSLKSSRSSSSSSGNKTQDDPESNLKTHPTNSDTNGISKNSRQEPNPPPPRQVHGPSVLSLTDQQEDAVTGNDTALTPTTRTTLIPSKSPLSTLDHPSSETPETLAADQQQQPEKQKNKEEEEERTRNRFAALLVNPDVQTVNRGTTSRTLSPCAIGNARSRRKKKNRKQQHVPGTSHDEVAIIATTTPNSTAVRACGAAGECGNAIENPDVSSGRKKSKKKKKQTLNSVCLRDGAGLDDDAAIAECWSFQPPPENSDLGNREEDEDYANDEMSPRRRTRSVARGREPVCYNEESESDYSFFESSMEEDEKENSTAEETVRSRKINDELKCSSQGSVSPSRRRDAESKTVSLPTDQTYQESTRLGDMDKEHGGTTVDLTQNLVDDGGSTNDKNEDEEGNAMEEDYSRSSIGARVTGLESFVTNLRTDFLDYNHAETSKGEKRTATDPLIGSRNKDWITLGEIEMASPSTSTVGYNTSPMSSSPCKRLKTENKKRPKNEIVQDVMCVPPGSLLMPCSVSHHQDKKERKNRTQDSIHDVPQNSVSPPTLVDEGRREKTLHGCTENCHDFFSRVIGRKRRRRRQPDEQQRKWTDIDDEADAVQLCLPLAVNDITFGSETFRSCGRIISPPQDLRLHILFSEGKKGKEFATGVFELSIPLSVAEGGGSSGTAASTFSKLDERSTDEFEEPFWTDSNAKMLHWECHILKVLGSRATQHSSAVNYYIPPARHYFPKPTSFLYYREAASSSINCSEKCRLGMQLQLLSPLFRPRRKKEEQASPRNNDDQMIEILGTLHDVMRLHIQYNIGPIPESIVASFVLDAMQIMGVVHENHVVHNDLGLDSFLIARHKSRPSNETTSGDGCRRLSDNEWCLHIVGFGTKSCLLNCCVNEENAGDGVCHCKGECDTEDDVNANQTEHANKNNSLSSSCNQWHYEHDMYSLANMAHSLLTGGVGLSWTKSTEGTSVDRCEFASKSFITSNKYLRGSLAWEALFDALLNPPHYRAGLHSMRWTEDNRDERSTRRSSRLTDDVEEVDKELQTKIHRMESMTSKNGWLELSHACKLLKMVVVTGSNCESASSVHSFSSTASLFLNQLLEHSQHEHYREGNRSPVSSACSLHDFSGRKLSQVTPHQQSVAATSDHSCIDGGNDLQHHIESKEEKSSFSQPSTILASDCDVIRQKERANSFLQMYLGKKERQLRVREEEIGKKMIDIEKQLRSRRLEQDKEIQSIREKHRREMHEKDAFYRKVQADFVEKNAALRERVHELESSVRRKDDKAKEEAEKTAYLQQELEELKHRFERKEHLLDMRIQDLKQEMQRKDVELSKWGQWKGSLQLVQSNLSRKEAELKKMDEVVRKEQERVALMQRQLQTQIAQSDNSLQSRVKRKEDECRIREEQIARTMVAEEAKLKKREQRTEEQLRQRFFAMDAEFRKKEQELAMMAAHLNQSLQRREIEIKRKEDMMTEVLHKKRSAYGGHTIAQLMQSRCVTNNESRPMPRVSNENVGHCSAEDGPTRVIAGSALKDYVVSNEGVESQILANDPTKITDGSAVKDNSTSSSKRGRRCKRERRSTTGQDVGRAIKCEEQGTHSTTSLSAPVASFPSKERQMNSTGEFTLVPLSQGGRLCSLQSCFASETAEKASKPGFGRIKRSSSLSQNCSGRSKVVICVDDSSDSE